MQAGVYGFERIAKRLLHLFRYQRLAASARGSPQTNRVQRVGQNGVGAQAQADRQVMQIAQGAGTHDDAGAAAQVRPLIGNAQGAVDSGDRQKRIDVQLLARGDGAIVEDDALNAVLNGFNGPLLQRFYREVHGRVHRAAHR